MLGNQQAEDVTSAGQITMINQYAQGTARDQRVTNCTITKAITMRNAVQMDGSLLKDPQELYLHNWFILDNRPSGAVPAFGDFFSGASPWVYAIKSDLHDRFRVVKFWRQRVTSTGEEAPTYSSTGPAAHAVDGHKFFLKTNFTTNWKDNTSGAIAACNGGALYWLALVSSSLPGQRPEKTKCQVYYQCTLYFDCV